MNRTNKLLIEHILKDSSFHNNLADDYTPSDDWARDVIKSVLRAQHSYKHPDHIGEVNKMVETSIK